MKRHTKSGTSPAKRRKPPLAPGAARKKVVVDFPETLLAEAQKTADELSLNRSNFIRSAVSEFIKKHRQRTLDIMLAEGYEANAGLSRKIAEEFAHLDSTLD